MLSVLSKGRIYHFDRQVQLPVKSQYGQRKLAVCLKPYIIIISINDVPSYVTVLQVPQLHCSGEPL